jgi:hypothetical protein
MTSKPTAPDKDDADRPAPAAPDAAISGARASVQEAIGTLLGDDAARDRGSAGKHAGDPAKPRPRPSPRR